MASTENKKVNLLARAAAFAPSDRFSLIANTVFNNYSEILNFATKNQTAYAGAIVSALNDQTIGDTVYSKGAYYIASWGEGAEVLPVGKDTDISGLVSKDLTIAGLDLQDSITKAELQGALGLNTTNLAGEANVIEEVQVNGVALNVSTDGKRAINVVIPDATVKSVKANDKVLKLEGTELSTELSLVYESQGEGDAAKKYIVLKGINDVEIAKIDASDFIADSFLNDVTLDANDNLQFTWAMADGTIKTDTVNIAKYIDTYTAGNGIDITDKKVSVKVDATSEFLSVSEAGVKVSGVSDAIDSKVGNAIKALNSNGGSATVESGKHVAVQVTQSEGKITAVSVAESDIASAQALNTLNTTVSEYTKATDAALQEVNDRIDGIADDYITSVEISVMKNSFLSVAPDDVWEKGEAKVKIGTNLATSDNPDVSITATGLATDKYVKETFSWASF